MRDTRREVRDKWQTILENLGDGRQTNYFVTHFICCILLFFFFFIALFQRHIMTDHKLAPRLYGGGGVAADGLCRSVTRPHAERPGGTSHAGQAAHGDLRLQRQGAPAGEISVHHGESETRCTFPNSLSRGLSSRFHPSSAV